MKYKAVIFDMDGTVLNTLEDLTDSLNYAMEKCGHRHDFNADNVRIFFGSGIRVAIRRALLLESGADQQTIEAAGTPEEVLPPEITAEEQDRIEAVFNGWYPSHCAIKTGPYDGILPLLEKLRAAGIKTAVVSNKIDPAVQQLALDYFKGLFDLAIGESSEQRRKPYPDMVCYAMKQLDIRPADAVYVGDSEVDMQTAENSGLPCISVAWGFRSVEFLKKHHAGTIVREASEIWDEIEG